MPRSPRRYKKYQINQDELWEQAWQSQGAMEAAKKQRVLAALHQRIHNNPRKKKLFIIALSAAAAVLVAVLITIPGSTRRVAAPQWQELASNNATRKITLKDGSELWLAPHSAIRINGNFSQRRSTVLTKGTVFFSVAKDAQHPFSIDINSQQVTVLGTAFSIQKLDSVDIQLTVKEGKVALDNTDGRRLLTAGQQVNTNYGITAQTHTIDPAAADWWLQQQVRLHNIELGELLNRVEAYYGVKLSREGIRPDMNVTLTWDLAVPLEDNLALLNTLTGYKIH